MGRGANRGERKINTLNISHCLITGVEPIEAITPFFIFILTAQWPVLVRLLSAVYNTQLLDPHCNDT